MSCSGREREVAPGVSVAAAHQQGALGDAASGCAALLPAVASGSVSEGQHSDTEGVPRASSGAIHIELPGCALITAESGADIYTHLAIS